MSESVNETYEVTDGKVTIQADAIRQGSIYRPVDVGDGKVYLAENRRREDDGWRMVMLSGGVFRQLQEFCNDMTREFGHRLEYNVTISGLIGWALTEERWSESEKRVLEYGVALYSGEKKENVGEATFRRIPPDVVNRIQQFGSHLSQTTGGLTPERSVIVNALVEWAVTEEDALDAVDDYNLELINERKAARQQARAQRKESNNVEPESGASAADSNGVSAPDEPEDESSDHSTVTKGTRKSEKSES